MVLPIGKFIGLDALGECAREIAGKGNMSLYAPYMPYMVVCCGLASVSLCKPPYLCVLKPFAKQSFVPFVSLRLKIEQPSRHAAINKMVLPKGSLSHPLKTISLNFYMI